MAQIVLGGMLAFMRVAIKTAVKVVLLMAGTMIFGVSSRATTYFVSPSGDSASAGTNAATSFKTIQKAASVAAPGDVVRVLAGVYEERVAPMVSGAPDRPITYIAESTNVVVRGFNIEKGYIRVIGFEVSQANNPGGYNYSGIRIVNAEGVQILDCYVHDIDKTGIDYVKSNGLVIRGNRISRCGQLSLPQTGAQAINAGFSTGGTTNVLIEYNSMSYVSDYLNPFGKNHLYRNNLIGPAYHDATVHIDGMQANGICSDSVMEANLSKDNFSPDNHFFLSQTEGSTRWIIRGNVTIGSKGGLDCRLNTYYIYHNTFYDNLSYWTNSFQVLFTSSTGNVARNNIWHRSVNTNAFPYAVEKGSTLDADHDLVFASRSLTSQPNSRTGDAKFSDPNTGILMPQPDSPACNGAGGITRAVGAGTDSTTLVAAVAGVFYVGDKITIGDGPLVGIQDIDLESNTITLTEPRTWTDGSPLRWEGRKEIGAYDYRSSGYNYSLQLALPGSTVPPGLVALAANVGNPEVVRMVEFRVDGIPVGMDDTAPFSVPWNAVGLDGTHTVEAIAYSRFASETLFLRSKGNLLVSASGPVRPQPPKNLRVN